MEKNADRAMAKTLLERAGGALTVDDILILRAAGVWHRLQWELDAERQEGLIGRQRAPIVSVEQKQALKAVGMAQRPKRRQGLGNAYSLDPGSVQPQLDRAEVATGYLYSLHGVAADGEAASFFSDGEPGLGPSAIMLVWYRIAEVDPTLKLTEDESAWANAALDKDDTSSDGSAARSLLYDSPS